MVVSANGEERWRVVGGESECVEELESEVMVAGGVDQKFTRRPPGGYPTIRAPP